MSFLTYRSSRFLLGGKCGNLPGGGRWLDWLAFWWWQERMTAVSLNIVKGGRSLVLGLGVACLAASTKKPNYLVVRLLYLYTLTVSCQSIPSSFLLIIIGEPDHLTTIVE